MTAAGSEKYRLEEMQRAERRKREEAGDGWTPRWFDHQAAPELLPGEQDSMCARRGWSRHGGARSV